MSRPTRDGKAEPCLARLRFSGVNGVVFRVQMTIYKLQPNTVKSLFRVNDDHTHTHMMSIIDLIPLREDQCEWHRMTRMTRPACAVMCNLINTHTHKLTARTIYYCL